MKKIIMAVAAIAMAVSMFAADFAATVNILGNVAAKDNEGDLRILELADTCFKDGKDLFSVDFSGDNAGAHIGIGTDVTKKILNNGNQIRKPWEGDNEAIVTNSGGTLGDLNIRSVSIWMKPADMIKITLGNLAADKLYCEHISWWRTPESRGAMNEFTGISLEIKPIDGLTIVGSLKTDWGDSLAKIGVFDWDNNRGNYDAQNGAFITKSNDGLGYKDWSIFGKYTFDGFDVGVGFHDGGKGAGKVLNVGSSFGNEWGGSFFGFVNVYLMSGEGFAFDEFALDNWFKFKTDAITASVRVPVALKFDMSDILMDWEVKVEYPVDAFNLYGRLGSNGAVWKDNPTVSWGAPYNLASGKFVFNMGARIGAGFNVGSCAMDACFALGFVSGVGVDWKIPFGAKVSF